MKIKIWTLLTFLILAITNINAQHNLTIKSYCDNQYGLVGAIDGSVLKTIFTNVYNNGNSITTDDIIFNPFSNLPNSLSDLGSPLPQVILVAGFTATGSFTSTITQTQADALISYVKNGGILIGCMEGVIVSTINVDANKYIGEALLCNQAVLTATPGGTNTITTAFAYHTGNGVLLLNSNGANNISTTGSNSQISGVPPDNAIMISDFTTNKPCSTINVLDFIVPAYPGGSNGCNIAGFAILSGESDGPLLGYGGNRDNSQLNTNYSQIIYDFLYNKNALSNRWNWTKNPNNVSILCPPVGYDLCANQFLTTPITGTLSGTNSSNPYHLNTYRIDNDLTISGDIYFVDAEVIIAPNVKITVLPGATLNIYSSHFHTCSGMWKGIDVQAGGKVDVRGLNHFVTTIIEDADIAVNFSFPNGNSNYTDYLFLANCTIFNRNRIGVKISNYKSDSKGSHTFPFDFQHCAFTSRKIDLPSPKEGANTTGPIYPTINYNNFLFDGLSLFPTPLPIIATNVTDAPGVPLSLASPYISNTLYPDNATESYLKGAVSGYTTNKPDAGIVLENVGLQQSNGEVTIGHTYCCVEIMPTLFDNLNIGIDASASNLSVKTCVFQKPPQGSISKGINLKNGSVNHAKIGLAQTRVYNGPYLQIIDNTFTAFYDLETAIQSDNYSDLKISYCNFRSSRSKFVTPVVIGNNGISAVNKGSNNLEIKYNEFTNLNTGMFINDNTLTNVQGGNIDIENNLIQATLPGIIATGNESCNNGICINGSIYSGLATSSPITCSNNTLKKVSCGITTNSINGVDFDIENNTIDITSSTTITGPKYGIGLFGGSPATIDVVSNNTITGDCNTAACNQSGIYLNKQLNTQIGCNITGGTAAGYSTTAGLTNGFRFVDVNTGTMYFDNKMYPSNRYGFTLEHGGTIGAQGHIRTPGNTDGCTSDNSWGAPVATWQTISGGGHFMTNNINSDPTQSPLVVYDNIWTNPAGSGVASPGFMPYQISDGSLTKLPYQDPPSAGCNQCGVQTQILGRIRRVHDMLTLQIADGTIDVPVSDPAQVLYVLQQQLYTELMRSPETANQYPTLQDFVQSNSWGSFDFIYYTGKYLGEGDAESADILLNYFPSENQVDDNYWQYYRWITDMQNDNSYQPPIADVFALANQCPALHGTVVFAAQNLYMQLTNQVYNFENVCDNNPNARQAKKPKRVVNIAKMEADIQVYPNPSKGNINIKLPLLSGGQWKVSVTDVYGKNIIDKPLFSNNTQLNLGVAKGLYIVSVTNIKTGQQLISKIVVE